MARPTCHTHLQRSAVVTASSITVTGRINDVTMGTVNREQGRVVVNGVAAVVSNRTFMATGVELGPGVNTITAVGTDSVGNSDSARITVMRETAAGLRIEVVSGDRQAAGIGEALAPALVVAVRDQAGQGVAGRTVIFRVTQNSGTLLDAEAHPVRALIATTDAEGRAQARFQLGSRSGVGNNRVEATSPGIPGAAVFVATGTSHGPAKINVDSGNNQKGVVRQALPRPFVAVVTDEGHNRLKGVQVTFAVVAGGGDFSGQESTTVTTDSDGRALAVLALGVTPGIENNVVTAAVENLSGLPAAFTASGYEPGDPAQTRISGVVLDNTNLPVPRVTLRVRQTALSAQTDEAGQFAITGAPVGEVHLLVDGSTAERPGRWPDLEYEMVTVPGANNTLGMPIYLLPLDLANGIFVDETQGGTLTLPDYPGFSLTVAANSARFPDGTRRGTISVTPVHVDKVPMVPNFGQQPRFIVTIQPPGVRFEPPAQVTHPNVDGLAPGEITEIYSFDHDMGSFVATGTATVSEDGLVLRSDPGTGVLKGGWHCGGNPATAGTAADCPECQRCNGVFCEEDPVGRRCDDGEECTVLDRCQPPGVCKGDPVEIDAINGACVSTVGTSTPFTVSSNAPDRVKWQAPGGSPSSGKGGSFSVSYAAEGAQIVTAACGPKSKSKTVTVGPSCAGITSTLNRTQSTATPPASAFGVVMHGRTLSATYKGCVDGGKWCFRLQELHEDHGFGVQSLGRTDITGANDANVTPTTCAATITDLTPPAAGSGFGPPRSTYWSRSITTAHENFHVTDAETILVTPIMNDLATFVRQAANCTDCKSSPPATFNAELVTIWNNHAATFLSGAEVRAHGVSNPMYSALISAIRTRARNAPAPEGWPAACK